jgi:hypothetical protein
VDADSLADQLVASGLPVDAVHVNTAEDDPNQLLGRPRQYVGKLSWVDTRYPELQDACVLEIFDNPTDLAARRTFLAAATSSVTLAAQYVYPSESKLLLVRLPHQLAPTQAGAYATWLASL